MCILSTCSANSPCSLLLQALAEASGAPATPPTAGSRPQSSSTSGGGEVECALCWSRPRDVLFLPCRHICCCAQCAAQLPQRVCPTCRTVVESQIEVFLS